MTSHLTLGVASINSDLYISGSDFQFVLMSTHQFHSVSVY